MVQVTIWYNTSGYLYQMFNIDNVVFVIVIVDIPQASNEVQCALPESSVLTRCWTKHVSVYQNIAGSVTLVTVS